MIVEECPCSKRKIDILSNHQAFWKPFKKNLCSLTYFSTRNYFRICLLLPLYIDIFCRCRFETFSILS